MKRTRKTKPTFILTGDIHLREKKPVCRLDDFEEAQWSKVSFIANLQAKYGCPVIHAGDLFDYWKPSPELLTKAAKFLPKNFKTIYGNHDVPQHNLDLSYKCGVDTLKETKRIEVLEGAHWGMVPEKESLFVPVYDRKVLVWHVMTYVGEMPWPGCEDTQAHRILDQYPEFDLIVTGHNHKTFVVRKGNRILVNPGSITRQTADQEGHEPCVFLYYAETNTIKEVPLPIEKGVITREHIDNKEQRNERIKAFVSRLDGDFKSSISFEDNLEKLMGSSNVRTSVKEIIYKSLDKNE